MATNYITTHGIIWGEISDTGVTTSYGHDALGSVTETFADGAVENTYRYRPYGSLLAKTGTAADPNFLWNGAGGYRATDLLDSSHYVRHRHYTSVAAQWTCVDTSWPMEPAYQYALSSPATRIDPSGRASCAVNQFSLYVQKPDCSGYVDADGYLWVSAAYPVYFVCSGQFFTRPGVSHPKSGSISQRIKYLETINYTAGSTVVQTIQLAPPPPAKPSFGADGTVQCGVTPGPSWTVYGLDAPGLWDPTTYKKSHYFFSCIPPSTFPPLRVYQTGFDAGYLEMQMSFETTCECDDQNGLVTEKIMPWSFNFNAFFNGPGAVSFSGDCT